MRPTSPPPSGMGSSSPAWRRRLFRMPGRRWRLLLGFLGVAGLLGLAGLELAIRFTSLPEPLLRPIPGTPVLLDRRGRLIAELPGQEARLQFPVSLERMNPWLLQATVGLEDGRYWSHHGIDPAAMLAAAMRNLSSGRVVSGASTLTQQLVKNSQPPEPRTLWEKISESVLALKLERTWSKRAILERYLNVVDYGNRFRGVEAAARQYFNKDALSLTPQEAIFLASLPRGPSRYNPWSRPDAATQRYRQALARLHDAGVVTAHDFAAWSTPPQVLPRKAKPWKAPHFVSWLRQRTPDLTGTVSCTLDLAMQAKVEALATLHLQRLAGHDARHAAILILDHQTGDVLAWHGSAGWKTPGGEINGVILPRSAGSTLKPFIYLQALDQRLLTAASLLPDTPDAIRAEYVDYDPRNYDQRFWGPVRLREALANSLNVPAVVTLSRLGARPAFEGLHDAGIRTARRFRDYGAGLILGNAEVRMLDVAAAYGAFANLGVVAHPRMLDSDPARQSYIASPEASQIIADILSDNDARRKSFGPFTPLAFESRRIPCKTGTSSGFRDAWTFGVTGKHAVGVWVGNFSGRPMRELASVTGPAPLWRDIVDTVLGADPDVPPPMASAALQCRTICSITGGLPAPQSPAQLNEWFLTGTLPNSESDAAFHQNTDGTAHLLLPVSYALWCSSSHNFLGAEARTQNSLHIVNPAPGTRFLLNPHLPRHRQQLQFHVVGASGPVAWRINGSPLPRPDEASPDPPLWPLVPGQHRLEAFDEKSRAEVEFTVE